MPQYTTTGSRFTEPATHAVSLSAKAKALTQFVLDGTALPDFLAQHGNVLLAFLGGAAASSVLYNYFYRNRTDRAKIKLAVFHITRVIEKTQEYHTRINRPHELVQLMQEEVKHLMNVHLNEDEAASTMSDLKRKLWAEVDGERTNNKRRKSNEVAPKDSFVEENRTMQEAQTISVHSPPEIVITPATPSSSPVQEDGHVQSSYEQQDRQDIDMVDIEELPIIRSTPPSRQMTYNFNASSPKHAPSSQQVPRQQKTPSSQTSQHPPCSGETPLPQSVHSQHSLLEQTALSSPSLPARPSTRRGRYDSSPPSTTKATPSFIGRSTYKYSSSDPEGPLASPVLEFRSKVQSSPRYGLNYDDNELYSSSSPSISATSSPPGEQHSTKARGRPPNMLQLALKRAAGLESSDTQQPSVETPVKIPLPPRPKAVKPRSTIKIQEAPNSLAVRIGDGNKGTWLHSIQEGLSPHVSPAPDVPRMRIAESRPFWRKLEAKRETRRLIRELSKKAEEIEQARQNQEDATQEEKDTPWPDPTFTISSSEEVSAVDVGFAKSPIHNGDNPPSALEISPPSPSLPSPPKEPLTPKMSSTQLSFLSDLPQSAINFSSPTQPAITWIAPPPIKKRGRGRPKKDQKPDTPMPPKRLGRPPKVTKQHQTPTTPAPRRRIRQISAEPQTPAQEETPSGRSAKRSSAFKGSYKC
jgi:hypothetical protein